MDSRHSASSAADLPTFYVRYLRRDQRALAFAQMPPMHVHGNYKFLGRAVTVPFPSDGLDAKLLAGAGAIPPVENHAIVNDDGLALAVFPYIGGQGIDFGSDQERKNVGGGVCLHIRFPRKNVTDGVDAPWRHRKMPKCKGVNNQLQEEASTPSVTQKDGYRSNVKAISTRR